MGDRQQSFEKKMMTTHNIYNVHTHPGRFIYALYIFQSTHKLPMWQVEKIGIHLGKVMKEKKNHRGKQELFTFNNSVAFNTSIYKQALIYVQTALGAKRSYSKHKRKIQNPSVIHLNKRLQVAEISQFTKKILHMEQRTCIFGELGSPHRRCVLPMNHTATGKSGILAVQGGFQGL